MVDEENYELWKIELMKKYKENYNWWIRHLTKLQWLVIHCVVFEILIICHIWPFVTFDLITYCNYNKYWHCSVIFSTWNLMKWVVIHLCCLCSFRNIHYLPFLTFRDLWPHLLEIPQGCQGGTRRIPVWHIKTIGNPLRNLPYTPKHTTGTNCSLAAGLSSLHHQWSELCSAPVRSSPNRGSTSFSKAFSIYAGSIVRYLY